MRTWNRSFSRSRGFTLIELVVVMVIIALLAGAAVLKINDKIEQGRRTRAIQDIKTFSTAVDLYEADNGDPPTTQQGLQALLDKPTSPPVPRNWQGPYLKSKLEVDPWGHDYVYKCPGQTNPNGYDIMSYAKDGQQGGTGKDEDVTN